MNIEIRIFRFLVLYLTIEIQVIYTNFIFVQQVDGKRNIKNNTRDKVNEYDLYMVRMS